MVQNPYAKEPKTYFQIDNLGIQSTMERIEIFSVPLIKSEVDLGIFKIYPAKLEETFMSKTKTNLHSQGENKYPRESINYLNIKLREMLAEVLVCFGIKTFVFNVKDIWMNSYTNMDWQESHVHPGAQFSFNIYYGTPQSNTVFEHPGKTSILLSSSDSWFKTDFEPSPRLKKGDIILFPSWVSHYVKPNSDGETISGNILIMDIKR
jgi:hypothetical protein